uniref:Cathepsin O n=1 Tax=Callorhinchus milii TaxID=7868 RepID=A0A4W3IR12_CALMI
SSCNTHDWVPKPWLLQASAQHSSTFHSRCSEAYMYRCVYRHMWNSIYLCIPLSFGNKANLLKFESVATYLCSKPSELPKYKPFDSEVKRLHLPTRFDWRDKNVVTRVRNQGSCGGCWAFSVVEVIESAYAIKGKPLQTFSAQEVIDCSYKDGGCNGGSPVSALKWLNQTRLVTESMYPFKAKTGMCHHFPMSTFGISIKGYQAYSFRHKEEEMMHKLLEWGPLIAVVDAVSWQDYLGGIIQHHCSPEESNHAVVITGYDRTGDIPYWIVRNSWGSTWGIDGFVHIKMKRNVCGIADSVAAGFV